MTTDERAMLGKTNGGSESGPAGPWPSCPPRPRKIGPQVDDESGGGPSAEEQFCWRNFLKMNRGASAVSVWAFPYAHLSKMWDRMAIPGLKTEYFVGKGEGQLAQYGDIFWIGRTLEYFGYLAKIIPEGYPSHIPAPIRWAHFVRECRRVGTEHNNQVAMIPPLDIVHTVRDWRIKVLKEIAVGLTSLPEKDRDIQTLLKVGVQIEVLDYTCVSRMKLGTIVKNIGGRIYVEYWDACKASSSKDESGSWYYESSEWVKIKGWSKTVGHAISHPENYSPKLVPPQLLKKGIENLNIQVGMKLEAVDPCKPGSITAATVAKVLNYGYLMISFPDDDDDGPPKLDKMIDNAADDSEKGNDWCCFHVTSPLIFYCGFAKERGIPLAPPTEHKGQEGTFEWEEYLEKTGTVPLDLKQCRQYDLPHGFTKGAKLEATDLVDPSLICVATVASIKGRLLKIHFDGWDSEFDQWMDCQSPHIFPVGWCELNGYPLQGPAGKTFRKLYMHRMSSPRSKDAMMKGKLAGSPLRRFPKPPKMFERMIKRKEPSTPPVPMEPIFDHEKAKAEAVKLGPKPAFPLLKRALQAEEKPLMGPSPLKQFKGDTPTEPKED